VPGVVAEYTNKASYIATKNTVLYAIWKDEIKETYVITAISHEGGIIEGAYTNYVCSVCGGTDHECEVVNVFIEAGDSTITEKPEDEITTYTVKFDANGGTGTMSPQTFEEGVAQNLIKNTFVRDGYCFMGWATSASEAKLYNDNVSYVATENTTLYAVWAQNSVSITSAELTYPNTTVGGTSTPSLVITPSDTEYESVTYAITSGSSYATINSLTGVVTGIADGTAVVKATIIDKEGTSFIATSPVNIGSVEAGTRYVWDKLDVNANFITYSVDLSSSGVNIDHPTVTKVTGGASDLQLYTSNSDAIINFVIGTGVTEVSTGFNITGGAQYTYDLKNTSSKSLGKIVLNFSKYPNYNSNIEATAHSNATYYLGILNEDNTCTNYVRAKLEVAEYEDEEESPSGNYEVEFTARDTYGTYLEITTRLANDYDDGSQLLYAGDITKSVGAPYYGIVSSSNSSAYPNNGDSENYWYLYTGSDCIDPDNVEITTDVTVAGNAVDVVVTPSSNNIYGGTINYTYEYTMDGGTTWTTAATTTNTSQNINVPESAQSFLVRVKASDTTGYTGDRYSYASVAVISNTQRVEVTFNSNGGTGTMASQIFESGVAQNLVQNTFERNGYTFKGWANSSTGAVVYTDGSSCTLIEDITLYAIWEAGYNCTVTFNPNGATSGTMSPQTIAMGSTQALTQNSFVKTASTSVISYTFKGWSTTANGAVEYANGASYTATGDITLYAVWEAERNFVVTFDGNGATSGTMEPQIFKAGVSQALNSNEFRLYCGYYYAVCRGWATTPDGGVVYSHGASYTATGDITLYAVWDTTPPAPVI